MRKKHQDLQPWLDYFAILQTYEEKGYLEVTADRHEAFVTQAALLTLLGMDETASIEDITVRRRLTTAASDFLQRIRGYAGFRSQKGEQYLNENFALHIVKDDTPHDLICTILLTTRRNWLRRKKEHIEVISYKEDGL